MIFLTEKDHDLRGYIAGIIFMIITSYCLIKILKAAIKYFRNPVSFTKEYQEILKKLATSRKILFLQDFTPLFIARKKLSLLLPFILSFMVIFIFAVFSFKSNFFTAIESILPLTIPLGLKFVIIFYTFSLICMSIYMIGYLITGEVLQRMFKLQKRNFILDMILNFLYSLPFLLILTFLWVIFALLANRDNNRSMSIRFWHSLQNFSLYALFEGFKYYTYINLARFSFSDIHTHVYSSESRKLFTENKASFLKIFIRSGVLGGLLFVAWLILYSWNDKFQFFPEYIANWIVVWSAATMLLLKLYSEQLGVLFHYVKLYHPENSFEKIGLEIDPLYFPTNIQISKEGLFEPKSKSQT